MYKVQTLNKISTAGLELLPRDRYEVATELLNPDAIVLRSFKMHDLELPRSLKCVARAGAGVKNELIGGRIQDDLDVVDRPGFVVAAAETLSAWDTAGKPLDGQRARSVRDVTECRFQPHIVRGISVCRIESKMSLVRELNTRRRRIATLKRL